MSARARMGSGICACPIAVVVSSPLSGWILDQWNWRVMLVASGVVPFVWLVLWVIFIEDSPSKAKWISPGEREYLERALANERDSASSRWAGLPIFGPCFNRKC